MGQGMHPQFGIWIQIMHAQMKKIEIKFQGMEDQNKQNLIVNADGYAIFSFCCSLQGI
jgi:hypothetical protein